MSRPTLYFSFMSRKGLVPDGPTYSLRDEHTRSVTLESAKRGVYPLTSDKEAIVRSAQRDGKTEERCLAALDERTPGWRKLVGGATSGDCVMHIMSFAFTKEEKKRFNPKTSCVNAWIERACEASIYGSEFEVLTTWGVLRPEVSAADEL